MPCTDCNDTSLPIGQTGAAGAQGIFGGYSGEWIFDTSILVSPLNTKLRFNSATVPSVTEIYISDANADSLGYDAFLDSFGTSGQYGYLRVFKKNDSSIFAMFKITGVTDNGTDHTLNVTYIFNNGAFVALDNIVISFAPYYDGTPILYNTTTPVSTANAAMAIIQSYTLPINKLFTNGDALEITAIFDTNAITESKAADFRIGGTVCHAKVSQFRMTIGEKSMELNIRVTRQSATTLYISFHQINGNALYHTNGADGVVFFESGFVVSDLSLNTTLLEIRGMNLLAGAEVINCTQMIVKYFKK